MSRVEQEARRTSPSKGDRGWYQEYAPLHFCFPPKEYPKDVGGGSTWRCFCGAVWMARGQQIVKYAIGSNNEDAIFGPERWTFYYWENATKNIRPAKVADPHHQEPYYDFRPLGGYYIKLLRELIEANGGDWQKFTD